MDCGLQSAHDSALLFNISSDHVGLDVVDEDDVIHDFFLPDYSSIPGELIHCCDMCGEKHPTVSCHYIVNSPRISDSVVSRARVTLPAELSLRLHLDASVTVAAAVSLSVGTVLGPMQAPRTDYVTNHQFPIKIFGMDGDPDQYIDARDENSCNWMCLVAPSAEPHLQNLSCLQMGRDIYFVVRSPVAAGSVLHVWYSPFYAQKLRHTLALEPVLPLWDEDDAGLSEVVLVRPPPPAMEDDTDETAPTGDAGHPGVHVRPPPAGAEDDTDETAPTGAGHPGVLARPPPAGAEDGMDETAPTGDAGHAAVSTGRENKLSAAPAVSDGDQFRVQPDANGDSLPATSQTAELSVSNREEAECNMATNMRADVRPERGGRIMNVGSPAPVETVIKASTSISTELDVPKPRSEESKRDAIESSLALVPPSNSTRLLKLKPSPASEFGVSVSLVTSVEANATVPLLTNAGIEPPAPSSTHVQPELSVSATGADTEITPVKMLTSFSAEMEESNVEPKCPISSPAVSSASSPLGTGALTPDHTAASAASPATVNTSSVVSAPASQPFVSSVSYSELPELSIVFKEPALSTADFSQGASGLLQHGSNADEVPTVLLKDKSDLHSQTAECSIRSSLAGDDLTLLKPSPQMQKLSPVEEVIELDRSDPKDLLELTVRELSPELEATKLSDLPGGRSITGEIFHTGCTIEPCRDALAEAVKHIKNDVDPSQAGNVSPQSCVSVPSGGTYEEHDAASESTAHANQALQYMKIPGLSTSDCEDEPYVTLYLVQSKNEGGTITGITADHPNIALLSSQLSLTDYESKINQVTHDQPILMPTEQLVPVSKNGRSQIRETKSNQLQNKEQSKKIHSQDDAKISMQTDIKSTLVLRGKTGKRIPVIKINRDISSINLKSQPKKVSSPSQAKLRAAPKPRPDDDPEADGPLPLDKPETTGTLRSCHVCGAAVRGGPALARHLLTKHTVALLTQGDGATSAAKQEQRECGGNRAVSECENREQESSEDKRGISLQGGCGTSKGFREAEGCSKSPNKSPNSDTLKAITGHHGNIEQVSLTNSKISGAFGVSGKKLRRTKENMFVIGKDKRKSEVKSSNLKPGMDAPKQERIISAVEPQEELGSTAEESPSIGISRPSVVDSSSAGLTDEPNRTASHADASARNGPIMVNCTSGRDTTSTQAGIDEDKLQQEDRKLVEAAEAEEEKMVAVATHEGGNIVTVPKLKSHHSESNQPEDATICGGNGPVTAQSGDCEHPERAAQPAGGRLLRAALGAPPPGPARCPVCAAQCGSGAQLVLHLRKHSDALRCRDCAKTFTRRDTLATHACPGPRAAAEGFTCPHCARLFTSIAVLRRHIRRHTGALLCNDCGRHFISPQALHAHLCRARLPAARLFSCPRCPARFVHASSLAKHSAAHGDRLRCTQCRRRFSGGAALRRHQSVCALRQQLRGGARAACRHCGAQLSSLPALARHLRRHEMPHVCATCRRSYRTQLQLASHVCGKRPAQKSAAAAAADNVLMCEVCAKIFTDRRALWQHKFTHAERNYACQQCDKKFKRKDVLEAHVKKQHGKSEKVACPECGRLLKSEKTLQVHMRLHTGDRRFLCDLCGESFVQKESMLRHRRRHDASALAETTCNVCGKSFASQHYLKEHLLQHAPTRDRKCPLCAKTYTTQAGVKRHLRTAHGSQSYQCPFCPKTTKMKEHITMHLSRAHADRWDTWRVDGFVDSLYSDGSQPRSILTLQPDNTILLLPSSGGVESQSFVQTPADGVALTEVEMVDTGSAVTGMVAGAEQEMLVYLIDVPEAVGIPFES